MVLQFLMAFIQWNAFFVGKLYVDNVQKVNLSLFASSLPYVHQKEDSEQHEETDPHI